MTSRRRALATSLLALLAGLALGNAGCPRPKKPRVSPAEQAYQFRDIFPFPAISGSDSDEGAHLQPLQKGYLIYISGKDFPGAAAEFDRLSKEHPDLVEARFLEGVSLVLAEKPADAVPVLESVVHESASYPPAHWFLGLAYFATHQDAKALDEMRAVVALNGLYADQARKVLAAGEPPED